MTESTAPVHATSFWADMRTANTKESLEEMSNTQPVLLVFLRHFGCSFCREAIHDIAKRRPDLEAQGLRIVMVHMAPKRDTAERFFKKFGLYPVDHISDPEKTFYRAFGLNRGTPAQLFGLMNWIRGFEAAVLEGNGFQHHNAEIGDGFQMPGIFIVHKKSIVTSYIHQYAWDRPDYATIASCCSL
jgi:peroxiredoxin